MLISISDYDTFRMNNTTSQVITIDHLGGFNIHKKSPVLDRLCSLTDNSYITVDLEYIVDDEIKQNYKNLNLCFDKHLWLKHNHIASFTGYNIHPEINYKNFICSFNGSGHVSRQLLVAILHRFKYFTPDYCSKNFVFDTNKFDGHINDYVPNDIQLYRKFFIANDRNEFFKTVNSFGHVRYHHDLNIYNLEHKLTQSFLHIVSETMATSYYPFVTEKFLYSIVTRGLFLTYAQPGWHTHLENYYGFRKYTQLFDYRFDLIQNPVERLVELMSMISKFSVLSTDDWRDLYEMESDTIEFNYNHYFSGDYLKALQSYA